jgi:Flp pilus assembly protein TadG
MRRASNGGNAMLEFLMVSLPLIVLTITIVEMSLESWQFHSMAYAIEVACRYATEHGRTCSKGGNACTIKVEDVANTISQLAPGLNASLLDVTLTTNSSSVSCNPLNSCFTNTNQFPNSTDNGVGFDITITASYPMSNPLPFMWFGSGSHVASSSTLSATTRQTIVY